MDTSLKDHTLAGHPVVVRMLVVAGALFGFTVLALAVSGAADASEGSPPPDHPGLLRQVGNTVHDVLEPAGPVLKPVTGTVHVVTSQVAPVLKPVTSGLEPVLAPLTRPVLQAVEPALSGLRPVLHALSPVTAPVLHATAPVTAPVARAIGAARPVPVVAGHSAGQPVAGRPAKPAPHADTRAAQAPAGWSAAVPVERGDVSRRHDVHKAGKPGSDAAGVTGQLPGSGGGGVPVGLSGAGGALSAGSGAQHGGEFAVTTAGNGVPGTDRPGRAPPAGEWSLHWLEFYGNDHPS